MANNKSNWEKAQDLLFANGVLQTTIDNLLLGMETNKEKYNALSPLLEEKNLSIKKEDNTPTLKDYFGVRIAQLLVKRKEIVVKEIDITDLNSKVYGEFTPEDKKRVIAFEYYKKSLSKLKQIDEELKKEGIVITQKVEKTNS